MYSANALRTRFKDARLELQVLDAPLVRSANPSIVQLDIERKKAERFRLYCGDLGNRIEVLNTDKALRQVVLMVDEPRRSFEVRVLDRHRGTREVLRHDQKDKRFVWVREWTMGDKRHLLCGMDEQHYFIAALPRPSTTVRQAHAALFNPDVIGAAKRGGRIIRQGEWFFVEASSDEVETLEANIAALKLTVLKHVPAREGKGWRRGRPHHVDELVEVKQLIANQASLAVGAVYARGKVRHPDHATIELKRWSRIFGNREASTPRGVNWVD